MAQTKKQQGEQLTRWMQQALQGDHAAYHHLLSECTPVLRAYVGKRINSADDAEEVVQEILISIHKARHTYDGTRPFLPWMYAIAHYRLTDYLRQHYRQSEYLHVSFDDVEFFIADDVTNDPITSELYEKVMVGVPEKQRQLLELVSVEGFTLPEAAKKLDMGLSAAKVSLHRLRKKLQQRLEELDKTEASQ